MSRSRRKVATFEKREIGQQFIDYLKERNLIRTWHRPELAPYYKEFIDIRRQNGLTTTSFSTALYVLGRIGKRELLVRGGTTIVFRGSADFRARSVPMIRKMSSQYVDIHTISERTVEWRPGHISRKLTDMSYEYSFIELKLLNRSDTTVYLDNCNIITRNRYYEVEFTTCAEIQPEQTENIAVRAIDDGEIQTTELEICLKTANGEHESILRYLRFEVVSDESDNDDDVEDIQQDDQPSQVKRYVSFKGYIPGEKPDTLYQNKLKMEWGLPNEFIPKELISAIHKGALNPSYDTSIKSDRLLRSDLSDLLMKSTYRRKFKMLLHIEEHQNQMDIKQYDMQHATLHGGGNLLYLVVPGLAEKRPSVLRGDRVYVKPYDSRGELENTSYEGYVHHVEQERVALGFNQRLRAAHVANKKYYVRFDFNRLALKLMQRSSAAILTQNDSTEILFPSRTGNKVAVEPVKVCNRLIENNSEQTKAVNQIASGSTSKVFIIFGPPGTGKTITMVEAIHQLLRSSKETHILVCAPSNSACDLLTSRLLKHVDMREILRMHAASRNWAEVPSDVKDVSNNEGGEFYFPAKEELMKSRIIVTTLITAGRIASAKFPNNHFNYVFIDEAGQAMEPEIMIAVAGVLATDGKIVLAGDPKQLGPVIRSTLAKKNGLQLSFLERLMTESKIHRKTEDGYDSTCVVKLLKNYRSHESIIHVPNELFYDNELQVLANEVQRYSLSNWEGLPKAGFPMLFHGVQGDDIQDSFSPSYFNLQEVKLVKRYVGDILSIKSSKVKPGEIGVITPYRRQVVKIRKELKDTEIKVGSVEEFQGQERRVIIISTVRSNTQHLQKDERFNLGFLRNPKRFNVAVTRAKALLIIVGNPKILCLDKQWRALLQFCISKGGYTGIKFDINSFEDDDVVSELQIDMNNLSLSADFSDVPDIDQSNPHWRQDP